MKAITYNDKLIIIKITNITRAIFFSSWLFFFKIITFVLLLMLMIIITNITKQKFDEIYCGHLFIFFSWEQPFGNGGMWFELLGLGKFRPKGDILLLFFFLNFLFEKHST